LLRCSVLALPGKRLKDVFSFQMSPRATYCQLRVERAWDRDKQRACVNSAMNLRVP
jgi:hypothetical protein